MEIGTGIAVCGVWLFAASCALSKTVSAIGLWIGIIAASIVTYVVV